jgi:hypothetical protein
MDKKLLDPKLQWGRAWNIWYNAQLRTLLYTPIKLLGSVNKWFRQRGSGRAT